jgi:hypothetical protein
MENSGQERGQKKDCFQVQKIQIDCQELIKGIFAWKQILGSLDFKLSN